MMQVYAAIAALAVLSLLAAWLAWALMQRLLRRAARAGDARRAAQMQRARVMHDDLLQGLQGLMLHFQVAADRLAPGDPVRRQIDAAIDSAERLLVDSRNRASELHESLRLGSRLARSLERVGRELSAQGGTQFRLTSDTSPKELHPEVEDEVRRILTEALVNAFRHARARHVDVDLAHGRLRFRARVRDDGIGIEPLVLRRGRDGGYGIAGMKERAACLGARLAWRARPGQGTRVTLTLRAGLAYRSTGSGA